MKTNPLPVLKINFDLLGENEKPFAIEVFDQRPGSGSNKSISYLNSSISRSENLF